MKYVILIIAVAILLLPTSKSDTPTPPTPEPVKQDTLDKETDVYRQLLSEKWMEFSTKRSTFKTDEEALQWINSQQQAVWKAAYNDFVKKAAEAAVSPEAAKSFSESLKGRNL